jgi:hypothetical protein
MTILVIGGVLVGIVLGQFFKCLVIPASGLAAFLILTSRLQTETNLWGWFIQFAAAATSLQIGYLAGLFARDFYREPQRSKHPRNPEISSSLTETSETGRRAA